MTDWPPCPLCAVPDPLTPCQPCYGRVRADLEAAPELYVRASLALTPGGTGMTEYISGGVRDRVRSPVRDAVLGTADELVRLLCTWERDTLIALGLPPDEHEGMRAGAALQEATRTLHAHLAAAVHHPVGVAFAYQTQRLIARLRGLVGLTDVVRQLATPCPVCDARALTWASGSETVECALCHATAPAHQFISPQQPT